MTMQDDIFRQLFSPHRLIIRAERSRGPLEPDAPIGVNLGRSTRGKRMAQVTTDHATIRKWAERHGGKPAAVKRTHQGGDVGIIRLMFPQRPQSEHDNLVEISWDEFFRQFEASKLALVHDEDGVFNKIVGRDTVEHREHGQPHAAR
jgi:hypothetical protein